MTKTSTTAITAAGRVVGNWDPRTQTARELCDALQLIEAELDGVVQIDLDRLPSLPVPEHVALYPVWAVDHRGDALVGPGADEIEPLASVLERYATAG